MTFVSVCELAELTEGKPHRVVVGDRAYALVRDGSTVRAVDDVCSHAEVSLSEGEVDDCTIECWLHGSRFDLRTGAPTGLPATKPIAVYATQLIGDPQIVQIEIDETRN